MWSLNYGFDKNLNLETITDTNNQAESAEYSYYPNNRLNTESIDRADQTYVYDGVGNRTQDRNMSGYQLRMASWEHINNYDYQPESNLLIAVNGGVVSHDEVGNTLYSDIHGHSYTYNGEGRLTTVTTADKQARYHYNGIGERPIKYVGSDTYLYHYNTAGQLLETQYYQGATQVWSKQIIWLGSLPLAQVTQSATGSEIVYLHADHLNTPRKATNDQQQVVWQWSSDAYGNGAANEDVDGDQQLTQIDLRFPGQIFDAESGLYYNYYRYYDPKTGRYITSDPIGLAGGINTFAYVSGNPVNRFDSLGLNEAAMTWGGSTAAVWGTRVAGGAICAIPIPGMRPLGIGLIALTLAGDTPQTKAQPIPAELERARDDGRIPLYHGTDIESAVSLLNGAPLSSQLATDMKYSSEKGISQVGFYLTPDVGAAEMFAARRQGGIVQFNFTKNALQQVLPAGTVVQPIPPGKLPYSPGTELIVLPQAFPLFDSLRQQGEITATPCDC